MTPVLDLLIISFVTEIGIFPEIVPDILIGLIHYLFFEEIIDHKKAFLPEFIAEFFEVHTDS